MKLWHEMDKFEKTAAVKAEIADDALSASDIASRLAAPSRMAVIGVCNRNNITLPNKGNYGQGLYKRKRKPVPKRGSYVKSVLAHVRKYVRRRRTVIVPQLEPLNGVGILFADRNAQKDCPWPLWANKAVNPKLVCGQPMSHDKPYCDYHYRVSIGMGTRSERMAHVPNRVRNYAS